MPRLEYKGILARAGTFKRKDGTFITKTWEEVKKSFNLTPELNLSLGHPAYDGKYRPMAVKDYIGRVVRVVNEEKQIIEGLFKFYDEGWDKLPQHIQDRLVNDEGIEISAGYTGKTGTGGTQSLMLHDHIAVLADGEDPTCPLGQCGINIRLEAENGDIEIMQFEQSTSTKEDESEDSQQEEPEQKEEQPQAQEPKLISFTNEQFEKLLERFNPSAKEPETTDDAGAEPLTEEPATEPPKEPSLEPERAFPAGTPDKAKNPHLAEDGSVSVPSDIYLGGTKRKQTT